MYEMMLILFVIIAILTIVGFVKYGLNIIFLYILLFSVVVIIWLVVGILDKKKESNG